MTRMKILNAFLCDCAEFTDWGLAIIEIEDNCLSIWELNNTRIFSYAFLKAYANSMG